MSHASVVSVNPPFIIYSNISSMDTSATHGQAADLISESDKCYICLSPFGKQAVASLENCQHVFCLQCILQWSQTANTCPVDRISFSFIYQRQSPGGDIQKKIKVKMQKKDADNDDDDDDEGINAVICEECGRSDRRHQLLVCIQCDSGYHMGCVTPSLNMYPESDWICPECAVISQHAEASTVEEEISDGELTDLLDDVDETAPPSSRLRPSTMRRPNGSTERRHSQRIRGRASSDPAPQPQTSWHVPKHLLRASKPPVTADQVSRAHHSNTSNVSVKLRTRKGRKRAT